MEILGSFPSTPIDLEAVLFDLDGTLVHMDRMSLELGFMLRAIMRFSTAIAPWRFKKVFWQAAETMQNHGTEDKNFDVLVRELAAASRWSEERMRSELAELLRVDFPKVRDRFRPIVGARELVLACKRRGYKVVLATNPVWPLLGVQMRLEWGGLGDVEFDYITNSENSSRCKPSTEYYERLLQKLELPPQACLMVGNDARKDLPAAELGVATFLVDHGGSSALGDSDKDDPRLGAHGTIDELTAWLTGASEDAA